MRPTKVLVVVGTRPEAVKLAPVITELKKYPSEFRPVICATAQHREMLDQVLGRFEIRPDYDLNVMLSNQTLSRLTSNLCTRLDTVLADERPDWVLVQGDTTTVAVASLVAFYHRARLGHVEAGLRTDDKWQPFPEEINRRLADVLADLHFAPTETSRRNLLREGVSDKAIVVTGNTVIDALLATVERLKQQPGRPRRWAPDNRRLILVTAHRRENFGEPLVRICRALKEIASAYHSTVQLIYPVHPNPNVSGPVRRLLGSIPNVTLTEPLDYDDLVDVMRQAYLIVTDSGGLQEEAPSLRVPVLVLREVTERPEGVLAGVVRVVGTRERGIVDGIRTLLEDGRSHQEMSQGGNPYGDGRASERIVQAIRARSPDLLRPTSDE